MMRLDKFLSQTGAGSRSDVKSMIAKGNVLINGEICKDPARRIDETSDDITCGGASVTYSKYAYFMMNKPQGVISASRSRVERYAQDDKKRVAWNNKKRFLGCSVCDGKDDGKGGNAMDDVLLEIYDSIEKTYSMTVTCVDLVHEEAHRDLFPVGRLDKDTEGLLLITDDGQLAHELLSPRKHVDKTYYAELESPLAETDRKRLEAGVDIGDEKPTLPASVNILSDKAIEITIHEGRFHQIKRMLETVGNKVTFLKRLQMGTLRLDESLKPGEYRRLTQREVDGLFRDPL